MHVPAGKFLMGSKEDHELALAEEKPQHTSEIGEYWIARFPVTHLQFEAFVKASSHQTIAEKEGSGFRLLRGGSFHFNRRSVRCAYRDRDDPGLRSEDYGFRVAASPIRF